MKYSKLQELVAGMNAIFNRVGTNNSNGASANVEFVLATKGPNGEIWTRRVTICFNTRALLPGDLVQPMQNINKD
jgi:hypothetical protein